MARFTKQTISKIGGFSDSVIAEELLYGTNQYWDITITDDATGLPLDLTNWLGESKVIKRNITGIEETRNGLDITGMTPDPLATEIDLSASINFYDRTNGKVRFVIDDTLFTDTSVVDSETPPVYTGYLQLQLPQVGLSIYDPDYIPPLKKKILLMFIIRSDGFSI
jgi:hypothetical protein